MRTLTLLMIALAAPAALGQTPPPAAPQKPPVTAPDGGGAHGGVGIVLDRKIYLLDLVEAGVQKDPFFDADVPTRPDFQEQVDLALTNLKLKQSTRVLIAKKLSELDRISRSAALEILLGMKMYSWRMVDAKLMPTYDEHTAILRPEGTRVQLASRTTRTIMLSKQDTDQLDDANLAALVFHEILFAFTGTSSICNVWGPTKCLIQAEWQSSETAQATTGFVFSIELKTSGIGALRRILSDRLKINALEESFPYLLAPEDGSNRISVALKAPRPIYGAHAYNSSDQYVIGFDGIPKNEPELNYICASSPLSPGPAWLLWRAVFRQYVVSFHDFLNERGRQSSLETSLLNPGDYGTIPAGTLRVGDFSTPSDCTSRNYAAAVELQKKVEGSFIP
jgi:hypothetical protein